MTQQGRMPPGVTMALELPERGRVRQPIPLTIRVINTNTTPVQLYFTGREITVDLLVVDEQGRARRKLEGRTLQAVLRLETLGAGDTLMVRDVLGLDSAGRYTITAMLLGEAAPYTAPPREIRID